MTNTNPAPECFHTLTVDLGHRSYPIYIGRGLLGDPKYPLAHLRRGSVLIVTNETVAPLYLARLDNAFAATPHDRLVLPDGEQYKTLTTLDRVYTALLEKRYDRQSTLVALGGGVIGDITGMAAATYQRGIDFVQVPTTLLAQVDSAVGGKTGVNHPLGKNMIGAFHQPRCVVIDTDTLETLPDRELSAGLAEIIKYGAITDAGFFAWLETHLDELLARDPGALAYAIHRSCAIKADIVAADEREQGQRALLNFGHSFGHAIETGVGYGEWLHGEAVGCGMLMAARMSACQGWLDETAVTRIERLLIRARLPVNPPPQLSQERFRALMTVDKKVLAGQLRLVLLHAIGHAVVSADFDCACLDNTLGG